MEKEDLPVPYDYDEPDWAELDRMSRHVHEWRSYVSEQLRALWPTFTDEQRRAIAANFQQIASQEEWE